MTRLDHNRAMAHLAKKLNVDSQDIKKMIIWGNHSATQYPDIDHVTVENTLIKDQITNDWLKSDFIPSVQQRGAEIIKARGASSAASAASAAIDHMHDWILGSAENNWVSMGVFSDGSYGIEPGIIYSFPVRCRQGNYEIIQDLSLNQFSQERMQITENELREERATIEELL